VAHPHVEARGRARPGRDAVEQRARGDDFHLGVAELALVAGLGEAAQLRGHGLHAVADAEQRQPELEDLPAARAGEPVSVVDSGPPERMMPFAPEAAISPGSWSQAQISQYTPISRMRRAISWVYCAPKSRIRILSLWMKVGHVVVCNVERERGGPDPDRAPGCADSLLRESWFSPRGSSAAPW
jgi:hypothetical protein